LRQLRDPALGRAGRDQSIERLRLAPDRGDHAPAGLKRGCARGRSARRRRGAAASRDGQDQDGEEANDSRKIHVISPIINTDPNRWDKSVVILADAYANWRW